MEFRCRLGTPGGEIIEGIYAADTEARLRQEFEEKGLYVLGISRAGGATQVAGSQRVSAPMPGKVVRLLVSEGQAVETGQGLAVVEAMKMQNEIKSPKSGQVKNLFISEGQTVVAGQEIIVIE